MARSVPVRLGLIRQRRFERVREIESLDSGSRWSALCQPGWLEAAQGIELGELFRITRGQVTGRNDVWVLPSESDVIANELTVPAVTRAREIINGGVLAADARSRACKVVNLPRDLDQLGTEQRLAALHFIELALARGVPIRATSRGIASRGSHSTCVSPRPLSSATWAADRRCFGRTRSA